MSILDMFFSMPVKDSIIILLLVSLFILLIFIDFRKIEFDFARIIQTLVFAIIVLLISFMLEREYFKMLIILFPFFSIFLFLKYIDYDRYSISDRVKLLKINIICFIGFSFVSFVLLKLYDLAHYFK